jgi:hypothetical protein
MRKILFSFFISVLHKVLHPKKTADEVGAQKGSENATAVLLYKKGKLTKAALISI